MQKINLLGDENILANTDWFEDETVKVIEKPSSEGNMENSNTTVKRELAIELLRQGLKEEAVCRILNISPDLLP